MSTPTQSSGGPAFPTTYGGLFDSLDVYLYESEAESKEHFGQSDYFTFRALCLHQAFDSWCRVLCVTPLARTELFYAMKLNFLSSRHVTNIRMQDLFNPAQFPFEYLVRGKWTSRDVRVRMFDPEPQ